MKTFPKHKTFKELGLDPKQQFRLINMSGNIEFKAGDILELSDDDGSNCPEFRRVSDGCKEFCNVSDLTHADTEKTWDNLEQGDVLKKGRSALEIQGVLGEIVFYTCAPRSGAGLESITKLKRDDWTIKQPTSTEPEPAEVTMAEVCEKFGHEVKIKKE